MTIWKYVLEIKDKQEIEMPEMAKIIHVDTQNNTICLWVLVNQTAVKTGRTFYVVGTGHDFNSNGLKHIGSCQMAEGRLVWHIFE